MSRFCTAIDDEGQPCPWRARPGQDFCAGHSPDLYIRRRCLYWNERGEACAGIALRGQDHCFAHSPRNHRAHTPPTPQQPRTRRQRAQAKRLRFRQMPQSQTDLQQVQPWQ